MQPHVVDFVRVIQQVVGAMERQGVRYALIGGFAMALRGVQRATADLDFILLLEDMPKADAILAQHGYVCVFRSENVSHFESPVREWGRIDLLHAFRKPSQGMLERAELMQVDADLALRVVHIEDIIGLKVQALTNDRTRTESDWHDIGMLVDAARDQGVRLDWSLIEEYLRIFGLEAKLSGLKEKYEKGH